MAVRWLLALAFVILGAGVGMDAAWAQGQLPPIAAPTQHIEVETLTPPGVNNFDPEKATDAYLARVPAPARAKAAAYSEGSHALQVIDALYTIAVSALLLWLGISVWMRDLAARVTGSRFWQAAIYVAEYVIVVTIATLPLCIYQDFLRERAYGFSNQSFAAWAGDFGIAFLFQLVGMTIVLTIAYAVIRAAKRSWWLWGALAAVIFLIVRLAVYPVFIAPQSGHATPLPDSGMKNAILSLAHANGIDAKQVTVFDTSRRTDAIAANVSGLFGTTRISLNDNLLDGTPSEVLAVMGRAIGHYVLNHTAVLATWFGILIVLGFAFLKGGFALLAHLFGESWKVRAADDPAGLPVFAALAAFFLLVTMPVANTILRTAESEADIFSLNAVRQPDAFAGVALKLGSHSKLDPGPWEEFVFYDQPSVRARVREAMRWKAEHIHDPDIESGPMSPQ